MILSFYDEFRSPRVERAANIRIQHPNLSTEDAMKLAGYTEEEARDSKRQSNVRQKTHRLTKGRKRGSSQFPLSGQKRQFETISGFEQDDRPSSRQDTSLNPFPLDFAQGVATSDPHLFTPDRESADPAGMPSLDRHRTPGSARSEKAARITLENPNLSIENAMRLAGFSDEEIQDTFRRNDIIQISNIMKVNSTRAKGKKIGAGISSELRDQLTAMDRKIEANFSMLEQRVDMKLKELEGRLTDRMNHFDQQFALITKALGVQNPVPYDQQEKQSSSAMHVPYSRQSYQYQYPSQYGGPLPSHEQQPYGIHPYNSQNRYGTNQPLPHPQLHPPNRSESPHPPATTNL